MRKNIKLLEEQVARAAERLKSLSNERNELAEEVEGLRSRVQALNESAPDGSDAGRNGHAEIISAVQEVLIDLRGE